MEVDFSIGAEAIVVLANMSPGEPFLEVGLVVCHVVRRLPVHWYWVEVDLDLLMWLLLSVVVVLVA